MNGSGESGDGSSLANEDALSNRIIGAAITVHRAMGPGLLESVYHECMLMELSALGIPTTSEFVVPLQYRGRALRSCHRLDLLVDDCVVVEHKSVDQLAPIHDAQLLTYLRLTGKRLGLILNFNTAVLKNGIRRIVL